MKTQVEGGEVALTPAEVTGDNDRDQQGADSRASGFSSLLFGKQQASGDGDGSRSQQAANRAASIAAALRREVVHAQTDMPPADLEPATGRRATTPDAPASSTFATAPAVAYGRDRAAQPPPVPDARRLLLRHFFGRSTPE